MHAHGMLRILEVNWQAANLRKNANALVRLHPIETDELRNKLKSDTTANSAHTGDEKASRKSPKTQAQATKRDAEQRITTDTPSDCRETQDCVATQKKDPSQNEATPGLEHTVQQHAEATEPEEVERQPRPEPPPKHKGEEALTRRATSEGEPTHEPAHSATDEEEPPHSTKGEGVPTRRAAGEGEHEPPGRGHVPAMTQQPAPPHTPGAPAKATPPVPCPVLVYRPRPPGGLPTRTLSTPIAQENRGDSNRRGQEPMDCHNSCQKPILQHQILQ